MNFEVNLFTRKELLNKPAILRRFYQYFVKPDPKDLECLLYPEELFVDIMSKLLNLQVIKKYDTESLTVEDTFGKYPCMVAQNNYVARENIVAYFKGISNINNWLSIPQLRTLEWYEQIIMTKLHLVTKILMINERETEISSVLRYIHSPIRSYFKYRELNDFMACCGKAIGASQLLKSKSNIQCYDTARDVYEKLSEKLGENTYFFEKDDPNSKQISSLDLVVYVYLKEQLVNIPESEVVSMLVKEFKNLVKFVERMDEAYNSPDILAQLRISNLVINKEDIDRKSLVNGFMQPTTYYSMDSQHNQFEDVSPEGERRQYIRRGCTTLMAIAFMLHLKYARTSFN